MDKEIVKLIRFYLKQSQQEFAKYLGVTYTTIADIESGHRKVSDNVLGKISHIFDASDPEFISYVERNQKLKQLIKTD